MAAHDAADLMRALWERIDDADWDGLARMLGPEFRAEYVHTGETFDRDAFVRLNREYPGRWHATVEEMLREGPCAVTRTRVTDGATTYFVASFGEEKDGALVRLVEVWADGDDRPPPGSRPED
jgi:hypothetical protein